MNKLSSNTPSCSQSSRAVFNRAARSPQGPGTKSTMDQSQSESKTTRNGKETSDIDKWKSESRAKANGQVANEHRPEKPEKDTKRYPGTENWPQEGRKWHHKRPKIVPRRAEKGARTIPNRKSNQEAHQDDPKTVLGLPQGAIRTSFLHL